MGGSDTYVEAQQPAPAPSLSSSYQDYVEAYPKLVGLEQQYSPILAQNQLDLLTQYGPDLALAAQNVAESVSPYTVKLQEALAKQAYEGMQDGVPDSVRQQYLDEVRANMGPNVGSPIAADYTSRGLLNLNQQYQNYFRDLGLSISGRQPVASYTNTGVGTAQAQPGIVSSGLPNALNYNASTYGNYINASTQTNLANQSAANAAYQNQLNRMYGLAGAGIGAGGFVWGSKVGAGTGAVK